MCSTELFCHFSESVGEISPSTCEEVWLAREVAKPFWKTKLVCLPKLKLSRKHECYLECFQICINYNRVRSASPKLAQWPIKNNPMTIS